MKAYLCVLTLFLANTICAQLDHFTLSGNVYYSPNTINSFIDTSYEEGADFINDSMYVRILREVYSESEKLYSPKMGFELIGYFDLVNKEKINIRSGIGLNFARLHVEGNYGSYEFGNPVIVDIDTIMIGTNTNNDPGGYDWCNSYTNSIQDLEDTMEGANSSVLNLKIPIEMHYKLGDKIKLLAAGYIQTPVFSKSYYEFYNIHRNTSNGLTECKWTINKTEDYSGRELNNLQIGIQTGMNVVLGDKVELSIRYSQLLQNKFVDHEVQEPPFYQDEYKASSISLGFEFKIK